MNILEEAQTIIYGDREKTYGSPAKNLQQIADLWSVYISNRNTTALQVEDVCNMMILLKVARLQNQPDHRDSQVDICGYAALMERCQSKGAQQNVASGMYPLNQVIRTSN